VQFLIAFGRLIKHLERKQSGQISGCGQKLKAAGAADLIETVYGIASNQTRSMTVLASPAETDVSQQQTLEGLAGGIDLNKGLVSNSSSLSRLRRPFEKKKLGAELCSRPSRSPHWQVH